MALQEMEMPPSTTSDQREGTESAQQPQEELGKRGTWHEYKYGRVVMKEKNERALFTYVFFFYLYTVPCKILYSFKYM